GGREVINKVLTRAAADGEKSLAGELSFLLFVIIPFVGVIFNGRPVQLIFGFELLAQVDSDHSVDQRFFVDFGSFTPFRRSRFFTHRFYLLWKRFTRVVAKSVIANSSFVRQAAQDCVESVVPFPAMDQIQ